MIFKGILPKPAGQLFAFPLEDKIYRFNRDGQQNEYDGDNKDFTHAHKLSLKKPDKEGTISFFKEPRLKFYGKLLLNQVKRGKIVINNKRQAEIFQ
jgi:hypothetical protein